jgi:hypothetical protein
MLRLHLAVRFLHRHEFFLGGLTEIKLIFRGAERAPAASAGDGQADSNAAANLLFPCEKAAGATLRGFARRPGAWLVIKLARMVQLCYLPALPHGRSRVDKLWKLQ